MTPRAVAEWSRSEGTRKPKYLLTNEWPRTEAKDISDPAEVRFIAEENWEKTRLSPISSW